ncbi:MAG: peptide deformylase [Anaerolineaceae bacterium 4572_32.2]|nr:MAG: peptide deformylase [Anaerolineaceae bacterium 4572_32.2]HEY73316.1 peptide deformylase [Thermoflexia bacterium]
MAVRDIVPYLENEAALRKKSEPVSRVTRRVKKLVRDLKDTLNDPHTEGIGLAAPQINVHSRVVVVRLGGGGDGENEPGPPLALIDPQVIEARNEERDFDGCLSFPGLYAETVRPHYLRVTGLDEAGNPFDRVFEGFDAVVVHHEIDHLDGVLFIDRVESLEDLYRMREDENGKVVWSTAVTHQSLVQVLAETRLAANVEPEMRRDIDGGDAPAGDRELSCVSVVASPAHMETPA